MSSLTIRPATLADADTLARFARALEREEGKPEAALTAAHVRAEGFGLRRRFWALIAERDGKPVGFALVFPAYATETAERGCYVQDLYIVPEARRQGVGRALMAAVARASAEDGGRYLFWNVRLDNAGAQAFYRALGATVEPTVTMSLEGEALARTIAGTT
jgi:ribosomal protein S18 acetylase RimI-like enzyme